MSTLAVVEHIMRETKYPMSVRDIVEFAGESLPTRSKTPDTVVARDLSMDIKKKGEDSLFIRTAPGRYTMREFVKSGLIEMGDDGSKAKEALRAKAETTPVLSQALSSERAGTLPAKASPADERRPATQSEDSAQL